MSTKNGKLGTILLLALAFFLTTIGASSGSRDIGVSAVEAPGSPGHTKYCLDGVARTSLGARKASEMVVLT